MQGLVELHWNFYVSLLNQDGLGQVISFQPPKEIEIINLREL